MQSLVSTHAVPAAVPPQQNPPVDPHVEPGQCASRKHAVPLLSPPTQTRWVATQGLLPAQLSSTEQPAPALTPPAQNPRDGSALHGGVVQLPPPQSQRLPSLSPPSHTPWAITQTPPGAQSGSPLHGCPSLAPAEHKNAPFGVGVAVGVCVGVGVGQPLNAMLVAMMISSI